MAEPISVEAGVDGRGQVQPKAFVWDGQRHEVEDIGRRWLEGDWVHVLVMTAGGRTWELAYSHAEAAWRLFRAPGPDRPASI
jgi:hypothetical protein